MLATSSVAAEDTAVGLQAKLSCAFERRSRCRCQDPGRTMAPSKPQQDRDTFSYTRDPQLSTPGSLELRHSRNRRDESEVSTSCTLIEALLACCESNAVKIETRAKGSVIDADPASHCGPLAIGRTTAELVDAMFAWMVSRCWHPSSANSRHAKLWRACPTFTNSATYLLKPVSFSRGRLQLLPTPRICKSIDGSFSIFHVCSVSLDDSLRGSQTLAA